MNRAKCSSSCENGSNHSGIITVRNRRRKLIGNQLARISNPKKYNINEAFRRARWPDVIPKLINSFVDGVDNDFFRIPITQKWIFNLFKFAFNLVIWTNLKSPKFERLDQVNASQLKYKQVNVGFLSILVTKVNERRSTNTFKNGKLLYFSSSIVKVKEGCKSFKQWKNDKASLSELKHAMVSST